LSIGGIALGLGDQRDHLQQRALSRTGGGGVVIAQISVGAAFAVNAATYVVFLVAMTNLRGLPALPVGATRVFSRPRRGLPLASRHPGIAPMLLLFTITTIGTRGFVELFPGFADSVFGRGPEGLAMLTSTVGLGAICGALWMLLRPAIAGLTRLVLGHTLVISLAILAFTATDRSLSRCLASLSRVPR